MLNAAATKAIEPGKRTMTATLANNDRIAGARR